MSTERSVKRFHWLRFCDGTFVGPVLTEDTWSGTYFKMEKIKMTLFSRSGISLRNFKEYSESLDDQKIVLIRTLIYSMY